jgi:hypothetical protein
MRRKVLLGAALVLAAGVWLATPTPVAADVPTAEQFDAAKTKADHEALAAEYEKLAEEAKQRSAHHTKLAEHYTRIRLGPAVRPAAVASHSRIRLEPRTLLVSGWAESGCPSSLRADSSASSFT